LSENDYKQPSYRCRYACGDPIPGPLFCALSEQPSVIFLLSSHHQTRPVPTLQPWSELGVTTFAKSIAEIAVLYGRLSPDDDKRCWWRRWWW